MSKLVITSKGIVDRVVSVARPARYWNGSIAECYHFLALDEGWLAGQACITETENRYYGDSVSESPLNAEAAEAHLRRCPVGTKLRLIDCDTDDFDRWGWELATRTRDGWVVDTDNLKAFAAHQL